MRVKQDESIWEMVAALTGLIIYLVAFVMIEFYPYPELAPGESVEEYATELEDHATVTRAFRYLGLIGFLVFGGSVIAALFRVRYGASDHILFCRLVHPDKHGPK